MKESIKKTFAVKPHRLDPSLTTVGHYEHYEEKKKIIISSKSKLTSRPWFLMISCLSSLDLALAEFRKEEGKERGEAGGVDLSEGGGVGEELREGFNLHIVNWPRKDWPGVCNVSSLFPDYSCTIISLFDAKALFLITRANTEQQKNLEKEEFKCTKRSFFSKVQK